MTTKGTAGAAFWPELDRLTKTAKAASSGSSAGTYTLAYMAMLRHVVEHAPDQAYRAAPEMAETLINLCAACEDSDGMCYGTLSTSFVRDQARAALASAGQ